MKCDELKVYHCNEWHNEYTEFYLKSDVDVSIDELKSAHHKERHEYINMIAELKAEINRKEAVEQRWFERCMEARTENIRLKRALWLARANNAESQFLYWCARFGVESGFTKADIRGYSVNTKRRLRTIGEWIEKCKNVKSKCRAKAEEYK